MTNEKDNRHTLELAIERLDDERSEMRKMAATIIGQLALNEITNLKCLPRLIEMLDDAETKDKASYALRVLSDKGYYVPTSSVRDIMGGAVEEVCPHCGHTDVMEVLCYSMDKDAETMPSPVLRNFRPLLYITAHCTFCRQRALVDKAGLIRCCNRCGREAHWWMEYRFHYSGMVNKGYNSPEYRTKKSLGPNFRSLYWQCKRCLRTWSPENIDHLPRDCPCCGMRALTYVVPNDIVPTYPQTEKVAASERNEIMVGGMPGISRWQCTECGHSVLDEDDGYFDEYI